jgi:putative transposase
MGTRYRVIDNSAFFVTTTAYNHLQIFRIAEDYHIGLDSLKFCLNKYGAILTAFVFMPNHWHGILWHEDKLDLSGFMRDFKRFTSVQLRRRMAQNGHESHFILSKSPEGRVRYRIWTGRFDVVAIVSRKVLEIKMNYIHNNPVRAGLVRKPEDWSYSSAGFYYLERDVGVPVRWIG